MSDEIIYLKPSIAEDRTVTIKVVIKALVPEDDLRAEINQEREERIAGDNALQSAIAQEAQTRAEAIEDEVQARNEAIAQEAQTRANAIAEINALIPESASETNKLADIDFVIDKIQENSAHFRGNWATYSAIPSNPDLYPVDDDGNHKPTIHDYLIVMADETQGGGTWRYTYIGNWDTLGKSGWRAEYEIKDIPFTDRQWNSINSGATQEKIEKIEDNATNIQNLVGRTTQAESDIHALNLGKLEVSNIKAGDNITLDVDGNNVIINSTGGGTGASSFSELTGSPYDNNALATALNGKANDSNVVHLTGNENIGGIKTFTNTVYQSSLAAGTGLGFVIKDSATNSQSRFEQHRTSVGTDDETYWTRLNHINANGKQGYFDIRSNKYGVYGAFNYFDGLSGPTPTSDTLDSKQIDTVGARNTKLQGYRTLSEQDEIDSLKADKSTTYTKLETNNLLDAKANQNDLDTVESIAKGAQQGVSFTNYQNAVLNINSYAYDKYNVGQSVYIVTREVPDLWVSAKYETSEPYTYTTDDAIVEALKTTGIIRFGRYQLSPLETSKVDMSEYAKTSDLAQYLKKDGDETHNGKLTNTGVVDISVGAGAGALILGADVGATTRTTGVRKLARINAPTNEGNLDISATILSFDTQGDTASTIGQIGTGIFNRIEFGGRLGATSVTAPDGIAFTVAKTHNGMQQNQKVYALEMSSTQARFNVQPNYNGTSLATINDIKIKGVQQNGVDLVPDASGKVNVLATVINIIEDD